MYPAIPVVFPLYTGHTVRVLVRSALRTIVRIKHLNKRCLPLYYTAPCSNLQENCTDFALEDSFVRSKLKTSDINEKLKCGSARFYETNLIYAISAVRTSKPSRRMLALLTLQFGVLWLCCIRRRFDSGDAERKQRGRNNTFNRGCP